MTTEQIEQMEDRSVHSGRQNPSIDDMAISNFPRDRNLAREMMSFSEEAIEFLARTDLDDRMIAAFIRMEVRRQIRLNRYVDMWLIEWLFMAMRVSRGREGRREAIRILIGQRDAMSRRSLRSFNTFDKQQVGQGAMGADG